MTLSLACYRQGGHPDMVCSLPWGHAGPHDWEMVPPNEGEHVVVDERTGGRKGAKKARFDLLPPEVLFALAEHYGAGAEKYDDHNWRKGYDWSLSFAAMQRHAWKFWNGEDTDPETGTPHMAAVLFHAAALLFFMNHHPEGDDRWRPESR